ncbi:MAG: DEAD/DEAH box helicase [Clostridia bacterium]
MKIELRDYQEEIYRKIKEAFIKGSKGVCAVLPCRSGKSYVFAKISQDACKKGSHVLILAHRNSLISQHKELFENLQLDNPNIRIESVFTEVNHLGENGPVDLIIIDEAHLSGASSYQKVCKYYNCLRILFTATPARLDGKPLDLADTIITGITANELIKRGNISDYNYYAPDLNIDMSKVDNLAGDFHNKQLGEAMGTKKIYGDILKYYNMLAKDKQAIAYCVNIEHSKNVCKMFNENGISARHMDSHTPEKEREQILQDFKKGKFKILCNCNLISEGITLPSAEAGLLLRPTLSLTLYIQQAMRCLTPNDNKKAIIIDYVNNVQRHGMPTQDREWSLSERTKDYYNENEDGTLKIRICPECFSTFETAPVCPFCGAEYKLTPVEIQNIKEIELKKIEEEKEKRRKQYSDNITEKVKNYGSAKECKNWYELVKWVQYKGYKPGYAYVLNKQLKLNFRPYGGNNGKSINF